MNTLTNFFISKIRKQIFIPEVLSTVPTLISRSPTVEETQVFLSLNYNIKGRVNVILDPIIHSIKANIKYHV